MFTILVMYVSIGVLFIVLGIPMAARRIPPNDWYGFRVPKTRKPGNEHIWYDANAYCGRLMIWVGFITAVGAVVFKYVEGLTVDSYSLCCMGVMLIALAIMIALSFKYLSTLK